MRYLYLLLLAAPIAVIGYFLGWPEWLVFTASSLGIVPLAFIMGRATEELAEHLGPQMGGLMNATLGNAAELIIALLALKEGLTDLVKASVAGSVLGNLLAVMGLSFFLGGLRNGLLRFDRTKAGMRSSMLVISVIAIGIPSFFDHAVGRAHPEAVRHLSVSVALVVIVLYGLWLLFLMPQEGENAPSAPKGHGGYGKPIVVLVASMAALAVLSEFLAKTVEPLVESVGVTEFFLGIFVVPIVGNVAEHLGAVTAAMRGKAELSISISLGSSLQIALLVTPLLVFAGLLLGQPFTLSFTTLELVSLIGAVMVASLIALDGEANWLEGLQLCAVYLILGLAFFFFPG